MISRQSLARATQSADVRDTAATTMTTKTTGAYDQAFHRHLVDNKIYPVGYDHVDGRPIPEDVNLQEITHVLSRRLMSLSISQFSKKFQKAWLRAFNERQVVENVVPVFNCKVDDIMCKSGGVQFQNLPSMTDVLLKHPTPDLYDGARLELLARIIQGEIGQISFLRRGKDFLSRQISS